MLGEDDDFFFAVSILDAFDPSSTYFEDMRDFIEIKAGIWSSNSSEFGTKVENITMAPCSEA